MKTKLFYQFLIPLLLFLGGNVWGQVTYTGFPTNTTGAADTVGNQNFGCGTVYPATIKAYISQINSNQISITIFKQDVNNPTFSSGTFKIFEVGSCNTFLATGTITSGTTKTLTINVSHTGNKYYRVIFISNSSGLTYYSNEIRILGTASTPPILKVVSCFNTNGSNFNQGDFLSGSIGVRNTPSTQSWSGNITVFLYSPTTSQSYTLSSNSYSIPSLTSQTINFSSNLNFPSGTYKIYCQYSNAPNGGTDFIDDSNNLCINDNTSTGTITPTKLIVINQPQPNLVCGTATISPASPIYGQPATFSYPLSNTGGNYPNNLTMQIRPLTGAATNLSLQNPYPGYISNGSSFTFIHNSSAISSPPGSYYLDIVDVNGNFVCTTPFTIVAPASPNLVCGTPTISPSSPVQGQPYSFSYPISNTGTAAYTGTLKLMWRDATNGYPLATYSGGIGVGSSYTFNISNSSLSSAPGTWYLNIEDTSNNVICSKTVTVVAAPSCVQGTGTPPATTSDEYKATQYLCEKLIIDHIQNWSTNYTTPIARKDIAKITYLGLFLGNTPSSPAFDFPVPFNDMQTQFTGNEYWFNAAKVLAYLKFTDDRTPFDRTFINFNPDGSIPRKYAIKEFIEAFNIPLSSNTVSPYSDVNNTDKMFKYIRTAYDLGLMTGNTANCASGTCFHPDDAITRQDAFIVLWRILTSNSLSRPTYAQLTDKANYFVPGNYRIANMNNTPSTDRGNFNHYQKNIFSLPGKGLPLDISFAYNSFSTELPDEFFTSSVNANQHFMPLSKGWNHSYNNYITLDPGYSYTIDNVTYNTDPKYFIFWADGSVNVFNKNTQTYETKGVYDDFTRVGEYIYITTKNQTVYKFYRPTGFDIFMPSTITDRNSNTLQYNYVAGSMSPANAVIDNITDLATNRQIKFAYTNINGKDVVSSITETGLNRSVAFGYNTNGNLSSYTDPKGQKTYYNYDDATNYNKADLLTEIILPKGNKIKNTYADRKLKATQTFNENNVATSSTNVNWVPNYSSGEQYPSTATITDAQNYQTKYTHNNEGNPSKIESPTGTTTINAYDTGNNINLPTSITINGQSSSISYDTKGNILNVTKNGITNTFTYTAKNDVETHTDGNGNKTTYGYDAKGNLTSVQRPSTGGTTTIVRNSYGQASQVTNPAGIVTNFEFDANGMVNKTTIPSNISSTAVYDNASRLTSTTDANGKTTSYEYDLNDNLKKTTDANGQIVQHSYDANDNHLTIVNPKNETQTNTYNWDDDTLASETFGVHTKSYTYNADGTLKTFTRGNGTFNYSYDTTTGRLNSDGQTSYTYDTKGNVKTITNTNGTLTLYYDANDRLDYYTDYFGNTVDYNYDNNNNVTQIIYPGNKTVTYSYDALNRCTKVTDWNNKQTTFDYLTDDRLSKTTLPNGTYTEYSYDGAGRPTGIANKKANSTVISSYSFTLDNAGNHLTETLTEPSITAGLQTIANATVNYGQYPYNRIQNQGSTSFTHNTAGGIEQAGSNSFTYDINDNMLTAPNSSFSYDGAGNRRAKTVNGANTRYVLSILGMSQVLMETNSSNAVQNYYVYGPTGLLYRVKADNTYSYYHCDYRGSTTAITNDAQNVTHSYSYDPFGKVLAKTEADANPYQYVGKYGVQYENPTLTFMRARYYDPTIGRFLSEDPIWHLNLYPYVDNNPVNYIDCLGATTNSITIGGEGSLSFLGGSVTYGVAVDDKGAIAVTKTTKADINTTPKAGGSAKVEVCKSEGNVGDLESSDNSISGSADVLGASMSISVNSTKKESTVEVSAPVAPSVSVGGNITVNSSGNKVTQGCLNASVETEMPSVSVSGEHSKTEIIAKTKPSETGKLVYDVTEEVIYNQSTTYKVIKNTIKFGKKLKKIFNK